MASSIAFIDESGDLGRRPDKGSSATFVLALVVFADRAEAERCRERIDSLRKELGKAVDHEFHFTRDSTPDKAAFLRTVCSFAFRWYTFTLIKRKRSALDAVSRLNLAYARLLSTVQEDLTGATIVVDGSGDRVSRRNSELAIRQQLSAHGWRGTKAKIQRSETDNLLQLADYVAGVVRKFGERQTAVDEYYRMLRPRRGNEQRLQE